MLVGFQRGGGVVRTPRTPPPGYGYVKDHDMVGILSLIISFSKHCFSVVIFLSFYTSILRECFCTNFWVKISKSRPMSGWMFMRARPDSLSSVIVDRK